MFRAGVFISFLVAASSATPAFAEAQQLQFGAATPGVCLFGRAAAIGGSRAGQAGTQRLQELVKGVEAELNPQQQAIVQENNALQAGQKTIPAAQLQQRTLQLQQRSQAFKQLRELRSAQLQRTKTLAEQAIAQAIDPALGPILIARKCSVLFERSTAYGWNPAMDLTSQVVQELDRRLPAVQINLAPPESVPARR